MKKNISLFAILLVTIVLSSCGGNNSKKESEIISEQKDSVTTIQDTDSISSVKIGSQVWATENLNVFTFQNGDSIPEAKSDSDWIKAARDGKPAWCYYNNNDSNGMYYNYGKLYNWYAVTDKRGLAPKGWHIPTQKEWNLLIKNVGNTGAEKLEDSVGWYRFSKDTSDYDYLDTEYNAVGFSAVPAGCRNISRCDNETNLYFGGQYSGCCFWSSTIINQLKASSCELSYRSIFILPESRDKGSGLSVRCIKDD